MSDEVHDELDEAKVEEVELADGVLSLDALAEEEEDAELDMDSYDDKDAF